MKATTAVTTTGDKANEKMFIGGDAPTNGGQQAIEAGMPYVATVTVKGIADLLFHRWNCEAVAGKAVAAKGSKEKKSDNVESYVYRTEKGTLGIPGEYLRQSIIHAAKFKQDPRSPRKSAMDLFKAGVVSLTVLHDTGLKDWDYMHQCRVVIQRAGITRSRPALRTGWTGVFELQVLTPEYITPELLNDTIQMAGKLVGIADFRPTYGRFQITGFTTQSF